MKLTDMTLEQIAMTNMTMLAGKLFDRIDYVELKKTEYFKVLKVVDYYTEPTIKTFYRIEGKPVYKTVYEPISYKKFKEAPTNERVEYRDKIETFTFKEEYNHILTSRIHDKEKAINNLYDKYYELADDIVNYLKGFQFIDKDYIARVEADLKPAMEHYIEVVLPQNTK